MNTAVGSTADTQAADRARQPDRDARSAAAGSISAGPPSTDNVGVTGYRIERCQGAGCTNFAQIAAPTGTGTTYSDTSAAAQHQLQLPRPRHRRRRQPQPLLNHRDRHHPAAADTQAPTAPAQPDRDRGQQRPDRPHLGRVDRQRRRHRLPDRALPGRRLHQLRPDRRRRPAPAPPTTTPACTPRAPATATASAPPTPPATSAPTPTPRTATTPAAADTQAADRSRDADREPRSAAAGSTSAGARRPTTSP